MMKSKHSVKPKRFFPFLILIVFLFTNLTPLGHSAVAQRISPPDKEAASPVVSGVETVNDYLSLKVLTYPDGSQVVANYVNGPSAPPTESREAREPAIVQMSGSTVSLPNFPSFDWVFGCGAVAGAMIATYYDRNGYPNIYTGPTNGGLMPLTDTSWGTWTDGNSDTWVSNPLVASQIGVDDRTIRGSIENYWVSEGSSADDPYLKNGWTQHTWGTAIGDYMKTSQSAYGNADGESQIFYYLSSSKYHCNDMTVDNREIDMTYGMKEFYEARGYGVNTCFNQQTDNVIDGGFTLAEFQAEIDSGYPVIIFLDGHFVVGYGYDGSTIYIRDTWDSDPNNTYTMTWGGSYSNMAMRAVSVIHLKPIYNYLLTVNKTGTGTGQVISNPAGIDCGGTCSSYFPQDTPVTLTANPDPGSTFGGWSGGCSGTNSTCVVTISQAKTVTATFTTGMTTSFVDVPETHWAYNAIEALFQAGITSGCATNPPRYCPDNQVTRAEMAKFLLKGIHGKTYNLEPLQEGESTGFSDVPWNHWAAPWIKQLAIEGITSGCKPGIYCPEQKVTRAEMAKFLLKAKHGALYNPTPPGLPVNIVQDPSFEASTIWDEYSENFGTPVCTIEDCGDGDGSAGPRTGDVWVWLGGTADFEYGYVAQNLVIPTNATQMQFYLWIGTANYPSISDYFAVEVDGIEVFYADATMLPIYTTYTPVNIDISAFADGGQHTVSFLSITDGQIVNFNLDDVSIFSTGSGTPSFFDVSSDYWAFPWIEQLFAEGITTGISPGYYGPENPVKRDQMAVFLVRIFNLP
jgi:hypothetical protein